MYNTLSEEEKQVIDEKGTESPFSGKYNNYCESGVYICKKCNLKLFESKAKFSSSCGWPSFDDDLGTVERIEDEDRVRIEIVCSECKAHLGHVFEGEGYTDKNTRYCVNSISLNFVNIGYDDVSIAYFAGGCFWGLEHYFIKLKGVKTTISGYMGGHTVNPDYESICSGNTGHLELIKVEFFKNEISYEELVKFFFEIHDFSQSNGQGRDIGSQYLSAIFYENTTQKEIALKIIDTLESMNHKVSTCLYESEVFYNAEDYHQKYYAKNKQLPYCHFYKQIFT